MDLGAFSQIKDLEHMLVDNHISVPRLRGLRWMGEEKPLTEEYIQKCATDLGLHCCAGACEFDFRYHASGFEISDRTRRAKKKYLIYEKDDDWLFKPIGIRWDRIHGKKRKVFKYMLKDAKRKVERNLSVFNKYAGREDVLYIHARIGGGNWATYKNEILGKPWFLEKVDDADDSTYCVIYARVNAVTDQPMKK